ncbi:MAG TPA: AAA family ATPase [Thermodesulfobacteriota bacterium]|nr:AAA family ATPase [Thermodesulfobacteriota bacterium]
MERTLEKLKKLRSDLKSRYFERDDVIDGAFCALLTGSHLLLIGPPGTAKSQLANEICRKITGARYFQWLLTKFTTPEELFGAVSLKGLENDEYRRVTSGKLPEAHIAFLDEVFKASSSILNTLLTIMNERIFYNGTEKVRIPLISLFGASNELPSEEDELEALYDRFLLRYVVDYIKEDFRFLKMLNTGNEIPEDGVITSEELDSCREEAERVKLPSNILKLISRIRKELAKKGITPSDRRYKQSVSLLKSRAYLEGRSEVSEDDLRFLENVLWREPGEKAEIQSVIHQSLHGWRDRLRELLIQAKELDAYSKREWESEEMLIKANIEAQTKLKHIGAKLNELVEECRERGKPTDEIKTAGEEIEAIQREILDRLVSSKEEMA